MKGIKRTIKRRRKEGKTDYKARFALLKTGRPRIVVRKTNRYIIAQLVSSDQAQDKVIASANSKELLAHGWPKERAGSLKNLQASYLTGVLLSNKIKNEENAKEIIFDIGLHRNVKKSRIYAFLKGLIDSGIKIAHSPDILPDEKKLEENTKTREIFIKLKGKLK